MKRFGIVVLAAIAAVGVAVAGVAEAKRLGSGGSMGAQRQSVAPKPAAPANNATAQPVMPAQSAAAVPAKPATPAAAPAAAAAKSGMSKWLGPIAGIAAGLGLAALLSHFGIPEGMGDILLLVLLAVVAFVVIRMLLARRAPARPAMQYAGGTGTEPRVGPGGFDRVDPAPATPANPTPAWGNPAAAGASASAAPGSVAPVAPVVRPLPPGFDAAGFADQAKLQFRRLQAAYDTGDRRVLADVMTPTMFAEVSRELSARFGHQPTEVVALNAEVLEVATEGGEHWASVRYTGQVREDGEATPKPIDEVWNLVKPVDGSSGWLLAGIQQTA